MKKRNLSIALCCFIACAGVSYHLTNYLQEDKLKSMISNIYLPAEEEKNAYLSVDDCLFWKDLIINEDKYDSAFESPYLNIYNQLHNEYDLKVTLNCFCSDGEFMITDVPTKFADEFSVNSDWIRFSFHAYDKDTKYDDNVEDVNQKIQNDYDIFASAVYKMTNSYDSIDNVVRLGFFTGTSECLDSIHKLNNGAAAMLCADDLGFKIRKSYSNSSFQGKFLRNNPLFYSEKHDMLMFRSQPRLENGFDVKFYDNLINTEFSNCLVFFTHEYALLENDENLIKCCNWAKDNNYSFEFIEEIYNLE